MAKLDEVTRRRLLGNGWPEESLECYEKFGRPVAFFYPFLDKDNPRVVTTPAGQGYLHNAYGNTAHVQLEGATEMKPFPIKEVRPVGVRKG